MLQLKNNSPFAPTISLFANEQGIDTLYVVVKGTFSLGNQLMLAETQLPPVMADEYWGEPDSASLKYATDIHLAKPSTDVVLMGQAWAPEQREVSQLDVRLAVAERQKSIRVIGNRVWRQGKASAPTPFQNMPLVYEFAYGGTHVIDAGQQTILTEERHPIGRGFIGKRTMQELEGLPLPNLEDPARLIRNPGDPADPTCFAFVSAAWLPRRTYAGTYDEAWQKQRAPYLPDNFDPRFFNCAAPEFVFDRYLQGGELVQLDNLSRHGPMQFQLPTCQLEAKVRIAGRSETPPLNLETVLIEPEEARLSMVWRAALPCDKQTLKVEQVDINLLGLEHVAMAA